MEIFSLLEKLEDVVENGWVVPLTGRTMVNKKELIELLTVLEGMDSLLEEQENLRRESMCNDEN